MASRLPLNSTLSHLPRMGEGVTGHNLSHGSPALSKRTGEDPCLAFLPVCLASFFSPDALLR